MISEIFLVLGAGVLAVALRSFGSPVLFRLGTLGFVATSFLAGWLLGGNKGGARGRPPTGNIRGRGRRGRAAGWRGGPGGRWAPY